MIKITKIELREKIEAIIKDKVAKTKEEWETDFGEPLVGFVAADDSRIKKIKDVTHEGHIFPEEILAGAKTIISYFLPFPQSLSKNNKANAPITRAWAIAYKEANILLSEIGEELIKELGKMGIDGAGVKPTHTYDNATLLANWSHRSMAYLAGLGEFGLNRMLITKKGCSGRYGSVVIDSDVELSSSQNHKVLQSEHPCLYFRNGGCQVCIKNCPSGALTLDGIDRHKCNNYMLKHCKVLFSDIKVEDVCGKCLTTPCAIR